MHPMHLLRIEADAQHFDYARCKTENCWCSVDAHFLEVSEISGGAFLPIQVANTSIMVKDGCTAVGFCKVQDQKLLTLLWHSFLGDSHDVFASIFQLKGGRYMEYG